MNTGPCEGHSSSTCCHPNSESTTSFGCKGLHGPNGSIILMEVPLTDQTQEKLMKILDGEIWGFKIDGKDALAFYDKCCGNTRTLRHGNIAIFYDNGHVAVSNPIMEDIKSIDEKVTS